MFNFRRKVNLDPEVESFYAGLTSKLLIEAKLSHGFDRGDLMAFVEKINNLHSRSQRDKDLRRLFTEDEQFKWVPGAIDGFRNTMKKQGKWTTDVFDPNRYQENQYFAQVFEGIFSDELSGRLREEDLLKGFKSDTEGNQGRIK